MSDESKKPVRSEAPRVFAVDAIHALRTAQVNTLTLSSMADNKASILMGGTFLVFSIAVSRLLVGELPIALGLIGIFSFLSTICAVLAVLPSAGPPRADDQINRLFFGHFVHIDEAKWVEDLLDDLEDEESIFRLMAHDIYQNGTVLQRRKFHYLSLAYRIFIVGLIVTSLAFIIEGVLGY